MRDILFRHIPSGADLMTRDLKMYMLGKERRWGREGSRGEEREENKRRRRNRMDKNCSKIKQDDRCKCVPSDTSVSYVLTESCPNLTTVAQESCRSFSSYLFPL